LVEACVVVKATQQISTCQQTTRVEAFFAANRLRFTHVFRKKLVGKSLVACLQVEIFSWGKHEIS
jgi:hypothetical protein